jgi:hypothetical protein
MSQNLTLFAYLDIDNPAIAWEVAIGRVKSSCDNFDGFGISQRQFYLLKGYKEKGFSNKIFNEFELELVRQKYFPNEVSRLKGVYFFETERDAKLAIGRMFRRNLDYLCAVNVSANQLTKVDSEWITANLASETKNHDWMKSYWRGETLGEAPLSEILVSGIGVLQNMELRRKAYEKILTLDCFFNSTFFLSAACCAFKYKKMETVAQTKAGVTIKGDDLHFSHFICMDDFNLREKTICEAVDEARKNNDTPLIELDNSDKFNLPNLEKYNFTISKKELLSTFKNIV